MAKFITNQNIEINLELAGLGDRILAFLIDMLIIFVYVLFVLFVIAIFSNNFNPVYFYILFLPLAFYSLLFEVFANGQSPGKKLREIRVVKLDGGSPTFFNYLLRWVIRPIDILIYGGVAILCIIITQNGQRLGDLAAGTTVIKLRKLVKFADIASIQKNPEHTITYHQVKRLNDKQIDLIRKSLQMRRDGFNENATDEIATKTKLLLQIESDAPAVKFLYTILKDYEYLHSS